MSLMGTQWGLVASSYLLGRTQDPQAIRSLLRVVDYEDEPFLNDLRAAFGVDKLYFDYSVAHHRIIGDALDRILVANAAKDTIGPNAAATGREYLAWRDTRRWSPRGSVTILPYDAPQTPYHLPGKITGHVAPVETGSLSLPIRELGAKECERIVEWARRFREAL